MKKTSIIFAIILVISLLAGCGGGGGGTGTGLYTLTGDITDSVTLAYLSGVTVRIGSIETLTTDVNGHFQSNQLSGGTYTITFSKTGYLSKSLSINLSNYTPGPLAFTDPIHIANVNSQDGMDPAYIQDISISSGSGTLNINAQHKVSMLFAIPYNTSSSSGSVTVNINDDSGSGLNAPPSLFSAKRSSIKAPKPDVMGKFMEYQRQQVKDLAAKGILPGEGAMKVHQLSSHSLEEPMDFWKISNFDINSYTTVHSKLKYKGTHCLIYVDNSQTVNSTYVTDLGQLFDNTIYLRDTQYFGNVNINIDSEDPIYILLTPLSGSVLGYFHSLNEYPNATYSHSNEKEMIYVTTSIYASSPSNWVNVVKGTIAHEFQHLINFSYYTIRGGDMQPWMDEGLAMVAMDIAIAGPGSHYSDTTDDWVEYYLNYTKDLALTNWQDDHYGNSYLFMRYFADRFGEDKLKNIVSSTYNNENAIVAASGASVTFSELLRDWFTSTLGETMNISGWPNTYQITTINLAQSKFINYFYIYPQGVYSIEGTAGMYISRVNLQNATQITVNVSGASSGMKVRIVEIPVAGQTLPLNTTDENPNLIRIN